MFTLSREETDGAVVLRISGEVDVSDCPALVDEISGQLREGRIRIALDLSDVRYIDSSGVRTLLEGVRIIRSHAGRLTLIEPSRPVTRILKIVGLLPYFEIEADAVPARSSCKDGS
jgi:anti-anti-sigma factor